MDENNYAVVVYLPGKLRDFVDQLRRRFDPSLAAWRSHVTILPPRPLLLPLESPLQTIRKRCAQTKPFDAAIRGASTFWPVSGVVYLSLSPGEDRLVQFHDELNRNGLAHREVFCYVPHVTIAQDLDEAGTRSVLAEVTREWSRYEAEKSFRVETLLLVQHTSDNRWIDLAEIPLG